MPNGREVSLNVAAPVASRATVLKIELFEENVIDPVGIPCAVITEAERTTGAPRVAEDVDVVSKVRVEPA